MEKDTHDQNSPENGKTAPNVTNANARQALEARFVAAYDAYAEAIFRHCYFKISDREAAKDLMQQAFAKAWQSMTGGAISGDAAADASAAPAAGAEIANLRAFLYKIAGNLAIDWYRKRKEQSLDSLQEDGFDPPDLRMRTDSRAELQWMMQALDRLDPHDKQLILWNYIEDIPYSEIARMIGEKPTTVSVRIHRAIKRLKKILHE